MLSTIEGYKPIRSNAKRRGWGRTAAASLLRSADAKLQEVITSLNHDPPEVLVLRQAEKFLHDAAQAFVIYRFGSKRLQHRIEKMMQQVKDLTEEVKATPVSAEEKLLAQRVGTQAAKPKIEGKRAKRRAPTKGKGKRNKTKARSKKTRAVGRRRLGHKARPQ